MPRGIYKRKTESKTVLVTNPQPEPVLLPRQLILKLVSIHDNLTWDVKNNASAIRKLTEVIGQIYLIMEAGVKDKETRL